MDSACRRREVARRRRRCRSSRCVPTHSGASRRNSVGFGVGHEERRASRDRAAARSNASSARAFAPVEPRQRPPPRVGVLGPLGRIDVDEIDQHRHVAQSASAILRHRRREHEHGVDRLVRAASCRPSARSSRVAVVRDATAARSPRTRDDGCAAARAAGASATTRSSAHSARRRATCCRSSGSSTNVPRNTRCRAARCFSRWYERTLSPLFGGYGIRCTR